jgi:hypothetical protein
MHRQHRLVTWYSPAVTWLTAGAGQTSTTEEGS